MAGVWARVVARLPSIQLTHHGMHGFMGDPMTEFVPAPQVVEAAA